MKYESELYHHGILGQKWGKKNGPPYPLNSSNKSLSEKKKKKSDGSSEDSSSNGSEKREKREEKAVNRISSESRNIVNDAKDIVRTTKKATQKTEDTSKMSDQEIRNAVNRMNLEQQYNNLKQNQTKSGWDYVDLVLSYAGDVAAIGGSIAGIILAISRLKK